MLNNLFGDIIGNSLGGGYVNDYNFSDMAAQRMAYGYESIDWARILANQFHAISLTRELTSYEKYLYNSALDAIHKEQIENETT